jgi:hypothetical protein
MFSRRSHPPDASYCAAEAKCPSSIDNTTPFIFKRKYPWGILLLLQVNSFPGAPF